MKFQFKILRKWTTIQANVHSILDVQWLSMFVLHHEMCFAPHTHMHSARMRQYLLYVLCDSDDNSNQFTCAFTLHNTNLDTNHEIQT